MVTAMEFKVTLNDVTRDFNQGQFAHARPLDAPELLETVYPNLNTLFKADLGDLGFGSIETGGAHPQEYFVNHSSKNSAGTFDFTRTYHAMRNAIKNAPLRHLWRGGNGNALKPSHVNDLEALLGILSDDMATPEAPFIVKAFDSQNIAKELKSSVDIVKKLQDRGKNVKLELAISYGSAQDANGKEIYPEAWYIKKVEEYVAMIKESGIDQNTVSFSLKDMVGSLDEEKAYSITKAILAKLKELDCDYMDFGIHCHDTGLALGAYAGAIRAAKEANHSINVDTVSGTKIDELPGDRSITPQFVNPIDLINELSKRKIIASSLDEKVGDRTVREILEKNDEAQNAVTRKYQAAHVPEIFSGGDLRKYQIPGGGQGAFIAAVDQSKISSKLGIAPNDAYKLVAEGLLVIADLTGHPLAVTPGFKNKQSASLTMINGMIDKELLKNGQSFKEMKAALSEIKKDPLKLKFIFAKLDSDMKEFLRGEMPREDSRHVVFSPDPEKFPKGSDYPIYSGPMIVNGATVNSMSGREIISCKEVVSFEDRLDHFKERHKEFSHNELDALLAAAVNIDITKETLSEKLSEDFPLEKISDSLLVDLTLICAPMLGSRISAFELETSDGSKIIAPYCNEVVAVQKKLNGLREYNQKYGDKPIIQSMREGVMTDGVPSMLDKIKIQAAQIVEDLKSVWGGGVVGRVDAVRRVIANLLPYPAGECDIQKAIHPFVDPAKLQAFTDREYRDLKAAFGALGKALQGMTPPCTQDIVDTVIDKFVAFKKTPSEMVTAVKSVAKTIADELQQANEKANEKTNDNVDVVTSHFQRWTREKIISRITKWNLEQEAKDSGTQKAPLAAAA